MFGMRVVEYLDDVWADEVHDVPPRVVPLSGVLLPKELSSSSLIKACVVDYANQKVQLPEGFRTKPCLWSASMHATSPSSPTAQVPFFPTIFLPAASGMTREEAHSRPERSKA